MGPGYHHEVVAGLTFDSGHFPFHFGFINPILFSAGITGYFHHVLVPQLIRPEK
jgi:hypothetical protein